MTVSSAIQRARQLRVTAVIILVLGLGVAELAYWLGTRSTGPDLSEDPSMLSNEKAATRQVQVLVGNSGVLAQELTDDLKRPGTQAAIIVLTSALVAGGCFYVAHLTERNG
jgi:hypothetical protein